MLWAKQIRQIPGMQWLNQSPCASPFYPNQYSSHFPALPNQKSQSFPLTKSMEYVPPNYGYYFNQNVQQQIQQTKEMKPKFFSQITNTGLVTKPVAVLPQQLVIRDLTTQTHPLVYSQRNTIPKNLETNQKMQPMMCIPMQSKQSKNYEDETDDNFEDFSESETEIHKNKIRSLAPDNSIENPVERAETDYRQIKQIEHSSEQPVQSSSGIHPQAEQSQKYVSAVKEHKEKNLKNEHEHEHKEEPPKKKKRRRRRRGIRINKKIGRQLLKGVHIAEDVAASGALGPQFKAAAIAAKTAETMINGAIKGKSADQIMKESAMTAASAAMGGSMKAQMMSGLAAQAGLPVPPATSGEGASSGSPLGAMGSKNLKQQLIYQAEQQALNLALKEAAKRTGSVQTNQANVGPVIPGINMSSVQPLPSAPTSGTNPVQEQPYQQQQMVLIQPRI